MEQILKVDLNGNTIGIIEKLEAHKTPVLHKAFSVFLINENKMLIQRRAKNKYHSSLLWTNSCCSHPRANLTFDESVKNRLYEELGITKQVGLTKLFDFTYLTKFNDNLFEYEHDTVLVGEYNGEINFNKQEIEEVEWIDIDILQKQLVTNPLEFSSWFLICAPKVIEYLKNKKVDF